jgi:hypothetical protein
MIGAWFAPYIPKAKKSFWTHSTELLGGVGHVVSVHLEIVLVSMHDRCMVCAKHIIGSEIVLDAPYATSK